MGDAPVLSVVKNPDPWAAMRLGAEVAQFLPLDPVAWVSLAERAGLEPRYCPPHGRQPEGMVTKVADTDAALREFLTGWLNTRPREEMRAIVDLLRLRRRGGGRGEPLSVPAEVVRACRKSFVMGTADRCGEVWVRVPVALAARLTGHRDRDSLQSLLAEAVGGSHRNQIARGRRRARRSRRGACSMSATVKAARPSHTASDIPCAKARRVQVRHHVPAAGAPSPMANPTPCPVEAIGREMARLAIEYAESDDSCAGNTILKMMEAATWVRPTGGIGAAMVLLMAAAMGGDRAANGTTETYRAEGARMVDRCIGTALALLEGVSGLNRDDFGGAHFMPGACDHFAKLDALQGAPVGAS